MTFWPSIIDRHLSPPGKAQLRGSQFAIICSVYVRIFPGFTKGVLLHNYIWSSGLLFIWRAHHATFVCAVAVVATTTYMVVIVICLRRAPRVIARYHSTVSVCRPTVSKGKHTSLSACCTFPGGLSLKLECNVRDYKSGRHAGPRPCKKI